MKCVMSKDGNVKRVPNEQANELVQQKGFTFVPKQAWKEDLNTTWKKASEPANPMSEKKRFRKEKRNRII